MFIPLADLREAPPSLDVQILYISCNFRKVCQNGVLAPLLRGNPGSVTAHVTKFSWSPKFCLILSYFALENRILMQMDPSPIQPDKLTQINDYIINNFSSNFRLKISGAENAHLLYLRFILGKCYPNKKCTR